MLGWFGRFRHSGPWRSALLIAAGILVISWVLVTIAWWLLPDARTVPLEIPLGTNDRIIAGETVDVIPDSLVLRRGDTLVIQNRDETTHRIGALFVPPKTTERTIVGPEFFAASSLVCSFHSSGVIGIAPIAQPNLTATIIPTAIIWIPTTGVSLLALSIARRLQIA